MSFHAVRFWTRESARLFCRFRSLTQNKPKPEPWPEKSVFPVRAYAPRRFLLGVCFPMAPQKKSVVWPLIIIFLPLPYLYPYRRPPPSQRKGQSEWSLKPSGALFGTMSPFGLQNCFNNKFSFCKIAVIQRVAFVSFFFCCQRQFLRRAEF